MTWRASARLLLLCVLAAPGPGFAQVARVGALPGPGGVVLGRVCLDLDGDGACSAAEPGITGARVRFDDGHLAVADAEGRFHATGVAGRVAYGARAAYGAHAVSADGLGVKRRFELAPQGAATVDLPIPPAPVSGPGAGSVALAARRAPSLVAGALVWPVEGTAPAGARIVAGEARAVADGAGEWTAALPLRDGPNERVLAIVAPDGATSLWRLSHFVARPSRGALRVFPAAPSRVATLLVRPAAGGAIVLGRAEPGVQLSVAGLPVRSGGDGRFGAWVPAAAGEVVLAAAQGATRGEVSVPVASEGAFEGLLVGELELGGGGDRALLASGRLAGSFAGRWRGLELQAGIDLDDRDRRAASLLGPREAADAAQLVDPRRAFVLPGDEARTEDLDAGRGRLWARVAGDGIKIGLGNGRTGLVGTELGRLDRTFFGARLEGERQLGPARLRAIVVGSAADGEAGFRAASARDQLAATGGSLYYLRHGSIVQGSEIVRIEWRDPLTRLRVAARELARGRDYELDSVGGRLLLARPVASIAPLQALTPGDPFGAAEGWIVVDYRRLVTDPSEASFAGGEVEGELGPVAVVAGAAREEAGGALWRIARGSAALDLGAPLRARLEVAHSDGLLDGGAAGSRQTSLDGGFAFAPLATPAARDATAVHAELLGEAGPARWRAWWRERPEGFTDGDHFEPVSARERGLLAEGAAGPLALRVLWADRRGGDPLDPSGVARRDAGRGSASVGWGAGPVALTLEGLHERTVLPEEGSQSAAGARAAWRAAPGLTLEAGHLQALARSGAAVPATFTSVGLSAHGGAGSVAVRAGWGPSLGPRLQLAGERGGSGAALYGSVAAGTQGAAGDVGAVGGRQRVDAGTLFTEERTLRDPFGLVQGRVVGAALSPLPGLSLTLSGERGERRTLAGAVLPRSAGGLGAAWSGGAVRIEGRAEARLEGGGHQWLGALGAAWSATPRLTLAGSADYADGEIGGRAARGGQGWLSLAWRDERWSALGRVGRVLDERAGIADRDGVVAALALGARIFGRARVGLSLDVADQRIGGAEDDRAAASVRAEVALRGALDAAVEYARRGSLDGRAIGDLDSLRGELGFTAGGARLSLGYTLIGFRGSGMDPEGETDGRFYVRAVVVR
jgi:hypothetical protein